ncbi:hypothetical protein SAMD00019534_080370 [Acytostelium subglobosum LB1]|uniref:hypothetical protein n=1 Tax=Acytostelium subglobosum LB1 TaxID=1410327 RepID=UPI000644DD92|nr:hypothetical protein SAMD00019534_080370 [Acytostelium subglobosum LB1]GAM24862.1 hypothetical protein SAMD00019534_080370 [Acytostelium subglobosum LB1]|eukprot:XP_012751951.1 hypothetical protein SAMD00019534_080370 [Acytostelium subglobosum LB1]
MQTLIINPNTSIIALKDEDLTTDKWTNIKVIQFQDKHDHGSGFDESIWERNRDFLREILLPRTLTSLFLEGHTDTSLIGLPDSLTSLRIDDDSTSWNRPIAPGILPPNLKRMIFADSFNQQIAANSLPSTLKFVSFGTDFNQPLHNLPASVIKLHLSSRNDHPIGTKQLVALFHREDLAFTPGEVFSDLTKLHMWAVHENEQLPLITSSRFPKLKQLYIGNPLEDGHEPIDLSMLPSTLTDLIVTTNRPITAFPTGLVKLNLHHSNPLVQITTLPQSLQSLVLIEYQHELDLSELTSLTSLSMNAIGHLPHINQLPLHILRAMYTSSFDDIIHYGFINIDTIMSKVSKFKKHVVQLAIP